MESKICVDCRVKYIGPDYDDDDGYVLKKGEEGIVTYEYDDGLTFDVEFRKFGGFTCDINEISLVRPVDLSIGPGSIVMIEDGEDAGKIGIVKFEENGDLAVDVILADTARRRTCFGHVPSGRGRWFRRFSLIKVDIKQ